MKNYYAILGVSEEASDQDIRAAYHRLLQESLMDTERFEAIKEAYEAVGTPESRKAYDAELGGGTADAGAAAPPTPPAPSVIVAAPAERTGTSPVKPAVQDATVALTPATCAVCGHANAPGETYCAECGFMLASGAEKGAFLASEDDPKQRPHLEDDAGQVYALRAGSNTVGREGADIQISDKTVSRHHATVVFHEDRGLFSVEDKASTNGTAVNGQVLPSGIPHPIRPGDKVRFGSIILALVGPDGMSIDKTQVLRASDMGPPLAEGLDDAFAPYLGVSQGNALARLTLVQGLGPREVDIAHGITTVGRLPDNLLCLQQDRYISGHHARVIAQDGVFHLLDVGSTNGTLLNGLRLTTNEAIAINQGDEITFGGTAYQFHLLADQAPADIDAAAPAPADDPELEKTDMSAPPESS